MSSLPNGIAFNHEAAMGNSTFRSPRSSLSLAGGPPMQNGMSFASPVGNPLRTARGEDVPMTPETNPALQQQQEQRFGSDAFNDWYGRLSPDQRKAFIPSGMSTVGTLHGVANGVTTDQTMDNTEGIAKDQARQPFARSLRLGQATVPTVQPLPLATANTPIGPTPSGAPQGVQAGSVAPLPTTEPYQSGYAAVQKNITDTRAAGRLGLSLPAYQLQQQRQAEITRANDLRLAGEQSQIDYRNSLGEAAKTRAAAATTTAGAKEKDVEQKPGVAARHEANMKAIADEQAAAKAAGRQPDYTKIKTQIDKTEQQWEKDYRDEFDKQRVKVGDRKAEDKFLNNTIQSHRAMTESRYPEVYGQKGQQPATTQPAANGSAAAPAITQPHIAKAILAHPQKQLAEMPDGSKIAWAPGVNQWMRVG